MQEKSKFSGFLETFIIAAIVLVLVETFLEDFSIISLWPWNARRILLIFGFVFDFIFVVEFLVRFYIAIVRRQLKDYILYRRGWVDFLSSFPLLILNSGPTFLSIVLAGSSVLSMGGILNILKVVKAIRIARILRLLRVLKIFKQIKHADSEMAQRHVAKITTVCITSFVFVIFFFSVFSNLLRLPSIEQDLSKKSDALIEMIVTNFRQGDPETSVEIAKMETDILLIKQSGKTVYSALSNDEYSRYFSASDYRYVEKDDYGFFLDSRSIQRHLSKDNIIYFLVIIILVIVFLVYYSPHFAITVTDPILIMKKGMEDPAYNLEVKIPEAYRKDDIFLLAGRFNEVFLPLKDRSQTAESKSAPLVELKIDDFKDIFEENT
ncbi:MAG: ion transporter [Spirochaetales bacterium]|nr:MAG: ion transporter [Spirochaetales bacterium]